MAGVDYNSAVPSVETDNMSLNQNGSSGVTLDNVKNGIISSKVHTSAAADAVKNHPITQSVVNGPVAENIMDQHAKTQAEFSNLAAARTTPSTKAATGQPLTHYHGFFGSLLSWDNPRASGIAYAAVVLFIFAARYLDIIRYSLKASYVVLGITVLAEVLGKAVLSTGLTSQVRPRKYYTVPKETLDATIGDVHELINFFVIEAQQIVFAENVYVSGAAFLAAFLSYYLIKIVPLWGLSLIGTSVLFLSPLVYKSNKEFIDHHLNTATKIIQDQTSQVKSLASEHAAKATETTKSLVSDYSAKAQDLVGTASAKARSVSPTLSSKPVKTEPQLNASNLTSSSVYKSEDFPAAPKDDFQSTPHVGDVAQLNTDEPLATANKPLIDPLN